jgi:hypothetical protein
MAVLTAVPTISLPSSEAIAIATSCFPAPSSRFGPMAVVAIIVIGCQKGLLAVLTVHGVWAFPEFLPSTSPGIPSLEASWIDAIAERRTAAGLAFFGKEPVEVTKKVQPGAVADWSLVSLKFAGIDVLA